MTKTSQTLAVPAFLVVYLWAAHPAMARVPEPAEHFGFRPGEDYRLANSDQIFGYFRKLAASSDRIRVVEFGRSSENRPMLAAFISSPENLRKLDGFREISRRLALGEPGEGEARALAARGKAIVWIDSGLHASEVAPAQHAPELAWRMVTSGSDEVESIRRNVILIQVPVINPDGLDMVAGWYAGNKGTRYETAPLPWLYQKYSGHDNNRDYFMLNLPETRHVSRMLFREWFPQIVYNQHQSPAFPARIFVPPYADPLNPNIPAAVMEGINLLGMAVRERMARENKTGVLSGFGFDAWWNGGLRSAPAFHNMHGILTETASHAYATPVEYKDSDLPATFAGSISSREPSMSYQRPWTAGRWTLRDAIDYMLTVDFALLGQAALRPADYLLKSWQLARASIDSGAKGRPFGYLIPPEQWDPPVSVELARRLGLSGITVLRASSPFSAGGKVCPAGTLIIPASQAFRPYLLDLMEPQKYPAGARRPYDVAGWTLPMLMGVAAVRIDEPFDAGAAPPCGPDCLGDLGKPSPDHRQNDSFLLAAEAIRAGREVAWTADGAVLNGTSGARYRLRRPRVGLYQSWQPGADTGWTAWLFDRYQIPYTVLHNEDMRKPELRERFDAIVLGSQSAQSILHGIRDGELPASRGGAPPLVITQRPEYAGGIGLDGLLNLDAFVRGGGTLVAQDAATELPIQFFPLPVRNIARGSAFSCPGSLLRFTVESGEPLAFGMPEQFTGFSTGGSAFEVALAPSYNTGEREVRVVARYAASNLLASGWIAGERTVLGAPVLVEARHGRGKVVLVGFRSQFRGQTFGTFKFLLNAVYLASAETAAARP